MGQFFNSFIQFLLYLQERAGMIHELNAFQRISTEFTIEQMCFQLMLFGRREKPLLIANQRLRVRTRMVGVEVNPVAVHFLS